ncbi:uncharacterized protein J7T54_003918 [Emericellopsis cladophorae]|uniref:DUF3669 domain-containing protein n=1 Tax=Emericellopsis cladophorae TaxID=2686198 RepID=A0A9P9Y1Y5_9HYPO|nr:uncharacterized protein J7T54_003918 [Emericellopsis cladophorae]KAI6781653.1 hypothetical protein J7T54_003918 [Emericellopsis cladophorae]
MITVGAPVSKYAEAIAEALAVIHWESNVDGFDIEFVLGSEPLTLKEKPPFTMPQGPEDSTDLETCETIDQVNFDSYQRTIRLWVLDFNLCNCWEEKAGWENPEMLVDHLVFAFFENDPYYPLPLAEQDLDRELWSTFRGAYLKKASEVLKPKDKRLHELPIKFMDACVERERQKLAEDRGHGSRDHKQ